MNKADKWKPIVIIIIVVCLIGIIIMTVRKDPSSTSTKPLPTVPINHREKFVESQKLEMKKYNIDITCGGIDCEVMNLKTEGSLLVSLQSLKPSFEDFHQMGFKQIQLTARDGNQTVDLEILK